MIPIAWFAWSGRAPWARSTRPPMPGWRAVMRSSSCSRGCRQIAETLALFDREARITSLLQHPNIVQVVDHNTTADGTEYLVMEYLAGESLAAAAVSERGPFLSTRSSGSSSRSRRDWPQPMPTASFTATSSRTTCSWCRSRGETRSRSRSWISGFSKAQGPELGTAGRRRGRLMGTPEYMSPEQVEGRVGDADAATDQFALAVIAYEMLTGRNPFQGDSIAGDLFARGARRSGADGGRSGRGARGASRPGKSSRQRFPIRHRFLRRVSGRGEPAGRTTASGRRSSRTRRARSPTPRAKGGRSGAAGAWRSALAVVVSISISFCGRQGRQSPLVAGRGPRRSPHAESLPSPRRTARAQVRWTSRD